MPTWGGILKDLQQAQQQAGRPDFDGVRRRYLVELSQYTGRATILYATKFAGPTAVSPEFLSINDEDMQGFMEVTHGLTNPNLDLILHSPGGSLEATEAVVSYLRTKFANIRVLVPNLAMSAATMVACAADRIVMGKHSFLGPTDPQLILNTAVGQRTVSAESIIEQFQLAQEECKDPTKLAAWIPMLSQYGPDLLVKSKHATAMARNLVQGWLAQYMFKDDPDAQSKAAEISEWLVKYFKSHGRHIPRSELEAHGLIIEQLEADQKLQDLVLSVFHAANHTFNGSGALKIIENHEGHAFVKAVNVNIQLQGAPGGFPFPPMVPLPLPVRPVGPPIQPPPPPPPPASSGE